MCTTQIYEGDLKEEVLNNAKDDCLRFFTEEFSYGDMQSVVLKGMNSAMFQICPEDPCINADLAEMLQTINFMLKLLRPFAAVCGQIENDYYFKH